MSGLRERQKAIRHDRIIDAATRLFREQGYEAVKMEAIAAAAEVAIGTIYNYYRNSCRTGLALIKSNTKALNPSCLQHLFQGL